MTMHLARGLTTLNTKKRKKAKLTLGKVAKLEQQMREHNKYMKSIGCQSCNEFKRITDYWLELTKVKTEILNLEANRILCKENRIYSVKIVQKVLILYKERTQQYSGERKLLGIATMHKSNLVPVFSDDDAKELAKMRR